jgi:protein gp37
MDARYDRDPTHPHKNLSFDLPVRKRKNGTYLVPPGTFFWTCFTSDFLLDLCDDYRIDAWKMIKERSDCRFLFITKRIDRFTVNLPRDWGEGYENVTVCVTCENQQTADIRLPILKELPIKHKMITNEPLLSAIDMSTYLDDTIEIVTVGGESGSNARLCRYEWVLSIRDQCVSKKVPFSFRQTGARFEKDGKLFRVPRNIQHAQAKKANIDYKE